MKKRSASCLIIILGILCLAGIVAAWVAIGLPLQAEQAFGAPAPGLGTYQRIYLSAELLAQEAVLKNPADPSGSARPFQVELGESTYAITERLHEAGLVSDAQALRNYLVYTGKDTSIQAGEYNLSPHMSAVQIAHALQDATPSDIIFRILPGWRIEEVAAALPTSGLEFSPESFLAAVASPKKDFIREAGLPADASLEGYLFPDRYQLARQSDVNTFIAVLLENFRFKVGLAGSSSDRLIPGFEEQGLSLHQAVTLASIIQREAIIEDEMPVIASVFFNRLAAGMRLDSDPTVQYALGFNTLQNTWWTNPLSLDDLSYDSPYNTYLNPGLPPGPISNPGLNALKAVAQPAQTPYYYFRAACDGSGRHSFAITFEEHQQNACR
jgi:UPF0755 protein